MSLLPWSLCCTSIFWFSRCSSGTNLAACGLSALHRSLLRHQNRWPRIRVCTTAFSLPGWYGALPSGPVETRSRFSFSCALLSPVYSVLSRRTRRFSGYKRFPGPLCWLWCCFHEALLPHPAGGVGYAGIGTIEGHHLGRVQQRLRAAGS